ncbi:MAG: glycosyltransferase family 4 protein [Clostridiales bacterium]|nr:glycosyltransferase family 4 protein [Clostridiales bacterium]
MKIVHIVLSAGADYTDGWSYQENTLPVLQKELGHDISLISSTTSSLVKDDRSTVQGEYIVNGVKVIRIKPTFQLLENRIAWFGDLYKVLERENPDLLFLHGTNFCSLGQVAKYKKNNPQKVVFFDSHVTYENSMNRFRFINKHFIHKGLWRYINQRYISIFSKGYYVAPQVKKYLVEMYGINPNLLFHLPMGTNVPDELVNKKQLIRTTWRKANNINENDFVLVTGGRFREQKKLFELLSAFKSVEMSSIRLVVFGKFENEEYKKKIESLISSDDRVKFLGWLNNEETLKVYLSCDLAVFSGSQSVIWRTAIACGLPIICNYSDGAEEMDFNGNLVFVNNDDLEEWKNAIQSVAESIEKYQEMRRVTEELAKPFFTEKRVAQMIIHDYETIKKQM